MCEVINAVTPAHKESIQKFGNFIGADKIEYTDYGKSENYLITKGDELAHIEARGNSIDGGYLNFFDGEGK